VQLPHFKLVSIVQLLYVLLLAGVVAGILCRVYFFETFYVPTESMAEAIRPGDLVLVQKFPYSVPQVLRRNFQFKTSRGQIVVFRWAGSSPMQIKRCVAVEGDTVEVCETKVHVSRLQDGVGIQSQTCPLCLKEHRRRRLRVATGEMFVVGDNLVRSLDSRALGPISVHQVVGQARLILFSFAPDLVSMNLLSAVRWSRVLRPLS